MKYIKQKLDICKAVAFVTFKEWGAYRSHSMVSIFVGPVYFVVQYFIWTAVYGDAGSLNGIELHDMIRYFGAVALIQYLVMDFADWNLSMLINSGKYLTYALRPMNHRFFAFSQKVGHRILGFIVEFIPCLLIFTLVFGIDMRPVSLPWLIVSISLAFMMNFLVNYCIGMVSFWIVETRGIRAVYSVLVSVFSGMLIPLTFFPEVLQKIQLFLPFQYISYVPGMVFLGEYRLGSMELQIPVIVGIQAVAVLVMFVISEIMYKAAMKRFTAVGA